MIPHRMQFADLDRKQLYKDNPGSQRGAEGQLFVSSCGLCHRELWAAVGRLDRITNDNHLWKDHIDAAHVSGRGTASQKEMGRLTWLYQVKRHACPPLFLACSYKFDVPPKACAAALATRFKVRG